MSDQEGRENNEDVEPPIDETGALDELGESRRSEGPDPILDEDVPASADRPLDSP
jgi:hypothetical protein